MLLQLLLQRTQVYVAHEIFFGKDVRFLGISQRRAGP